MSCWLPLVAICLFAAELAAASSRVSINSDAVLVIDGQEVFPTGFTTPPAPEGRPPTGNSGLGELGKADGFIDWFGPFEVDFDRLGASQL